MKTVIRTADIGDSGAVSEISRDDLGYDCSPDFVREKLKKLDLDREAVFAAESEEGVVGYIHVEKYDTLYSETLANILGFAVRRSCRRKGIGRLLINEAEKWAKSHGAAGLRLNSGAERTDAHSFYRAVGFDSEKQQLRFIKMF
ncbi:MAG: GNAT family N-acetyltransferase [Huintestinicola sp.]